MEERGILEAPQHLQTAQFYLSLLRARHDDWVATRDLILEIIVIVLISAEIIFGWSEGNKQAAILGDMKTSTAATATALQAQGSILSKMNDNTSATVTAEPHNFKAFRPGDSPESKGSSARARQSGAEVRFARGTNVLTVRQTQVPLE